MKGTAARDRKRRREMGPGLRWKQVAPKRPKSQLDMLTNVGSMLKDIRIRSVS